MQALYKEVRITVVGTTRSQDKDSVPLGPNLALRLKRYVEQRHGSNAPPERLLFSFTKRGCIHEGTVSQTFHIRPHDQQQAATHPRLLL